MSILIHELTGVLFYENGNFSQILEGRREDVLFLWENIQKDYRHDILHRIEFGEIDQRLFPTWQDCLMVFRAMMLNY